MNTVVAQSRKISRDEGNTPDSKFWDKIAPRYAARPVPNPDAYAQKLKLTQKYLNSDDTVLEIGCGTGSTSLAHASKVSRIHATDLSHGMIDIARQNCRAANVTNVDFSVATARHALLQGEQSDAVLSLNLLHLMTDWREVIALTHRHLDVGGVFVTSTPCLLESHAWFRWVSAPLARLGLIPHVVFFYQEELLEALKTAGFSIEETFKQTDSNGLFVVARKTHD